MTRAAAALLPRMVRAIPCSRWMCGRRPGAHADRGCTTLALGDRRRSRLRPRAALLALFDQRRSRRRAAPVVHGPRGCAQFALVALAFALLCAPPAFGQAELLQTGDAEAAANAGAETGSAESEAAARAARTRELLLSPRDTMHTLLVSMHALWSDPQAWERAVATLDAANLEEQQARERVRLLYAALNRIEEVDVARLPDRTQAQGMLRYRYFPDPQRDRKLLASLGEVPAGGIELVRGEDEAWRFSAETVAGIPALHRQVERFAPLAGKEILTVGDWIEARLPEALTERRLLNVKYWAWIALFLVILLGLVTDLLTRSVLAGVSRRWADRIAGGRTPEQLRAALRPVGFTAAVLVWMLPVHFLGLPPAAERVLSSALNVLLVVLLTFSAWRAIDLVEATLLLKAERTPSPIDNLLVVLVSRAVKIFVLVMGVIYTADVFGIPIVPLLASLTVAGVGISFAAKDTLENFFGSIAVALDSPFGIGDWVVVDGKEGTVERVGLRSTQIRSFYDSQITVPNSNLVRTSVDNYGRRTYRRWSTVIGLQYDTEPEKLVAFTEGVCELVRTHPCTRKDYFHVRCNEFGPSSLDILLYVFFEVPDWSAELRERERLFLDIVRLAARLGVQFAFPTRTVHLAPAEEGAGAEGDGAGATGTGGAAPDGFADARGREIGVQAARELLQRSS